MSKTIRFRSALSKCLSTRRAVNLALRRSLFAGAAALLVAGCAAVEYTGKPVNREIKALPKTDATEHASPPLLPSEAQPAAPAPAAKPEAKVQAEPLRITLEGALVMALEHNRSLSVQKVSPELKRTLVAEQRAVFDPAMVAGYSRAENHMTHDLLIDTQMAGTNNANATVRLPVETDSTTRKDSGSVGLSQTLPTGTDISLTYGPSRTTTDNGTSNINATGRQTDTSVNDSSVQLSITQSLLRGAGLGVNLASLRQAKLDLVSSEYELRGVAEDLISQVEQTYWSYVLALRQIKIYEESLAVAQTQLDEVNTRIGLGKLAETERAPAEAEVAQRRSSLIDARSSHEKVRLALLRLLNPAETDWAGQDVVPQTEPTISDVPLDRVADSIALAMRMRPDLNQARLQIKRDDLEVVKTKNGLLPQLDLFINLGKTLSRTSYADSFMVSRQDLRDSGYSSQVGIQFSYPIGNRAARARDERATLTRGRDQGALANMAQLAEQDVRTAYVEIRRAKEQIAANQAKRQLQEQVLQIETERYRVGKSTPLNVAQAQRDLVSAQIGEVQAISAYLQAIVGLYGVEGSLLERRGIECPGKDPVDLDEAQKLVPVH